MIIIIIHLVISFLLDGFMSNYTEVLSINPSYLKTIYTIISLVIIFRYFSTEKKYLIIITITGILFDIVYTNTFLLNPFIFFIIYLIIKLLEYYIPNNLFTVNIKTIIAIIIYHTITYFLLQVSSYHHYELSTLLTVITHSLIATIIYTSVSYLILTKIFFKKYDKKII